MNILFCIDHNEVPFFQYRDLFPRSTKVNTRIRYVVMYVKIYIWAKFIQSLFQIGWISLTGIAQPAKYRSLFIRP